MEDRRATSRYAKACRECATTKAKCIRNGNSLKCERCMRLNKECKARITTYRALRAPKPNRLTQMEQKLDGLVTLLVATQPQRQPSTSSDSAPSLTPSSSSTEMTTVQGGPIQLPFVPDVTLQGKTKVCLCSGEPSMNRTEDIIGDVPVWPKSHSPGKDGPIASLELTNEAAEALLENYQTSMAKYFPFVVISESTTVQELQTAKPFLFLTVMTVSSYQRTGQQMTTSTEIMRRLSDQMLLKGEKSLDLLQGILVYIEWYQSHRLLDPQLTNLLHLAIALLVDLGLNKTPHTFDHQQPTIPDSTDIINGRTFPRGRSNDERRVFLGCFYFTSTISSCFKKVDGLRYTAHIEESCNVLSQHPEYESDEYLVQLVRLQSIAEQITHTLPYDLPQSLWTPGTPIKLLVNGFHRELQSFQASLPQSFKEDILLQSHILNTSVHLFEISLSDWSRQQPPSNSSSRSSSSNNPDHRLEILHRALLSSSSLLTAFLTYPSSEYSSLPFVMWGQIVHAMQVLSKLSLLAATSSPPSWSYTSSSFPSCSTTSAPASSSFPACSSMNAVAPGGNNNNNSNNENDDDDNNNNNLLVPGWSLSHVQETIDFPTILDKLCAKFEEQRIIEEETNQRNNNITTTTTNTNPATTTAATNSGGSSGSGSGSSGIWPGPPFGSRYEIYAGRLVKVKAWYEVKLRSLQGGRGGVHSGGGTSGGSSAGGVISAEGGRGRLDADHDLQTDLYGVMGGPAQSAGLPQRQHSHSHQQQQQQQVPSTATSTAPASAGGGMGMGMGMESSSEFLSLEMLEQMDDAYWHDFLTEWASL